LACHLQVDTDPDPDPACHFDAEPDPAYHFDTDTDPTFPFDADPCGFRTTTLADTYKQLQIRIREAQQHTDPDTTTASVQDPE
jgi:hypothetical protein